MTDTDSSRLKERLSREITGEVFFDAFNRGRYATDASFYQIVPSGVVVPKTMDEALLALAIARDEGVKVTPRGGGTSPKCMRVPSASAASSAIVLSRIVP